jgi:hypothetical protein
MDEELEREALEEELEQEALEDAMEEELELAIAREEALNEGLLAFLDREEAQEEAQGPVVQRPADGPGRANLAELQNAVVQLRRNVVAASTRKSYANSIARMLQWFYLNLPHLLTDGFMAGVEDRVAGPTRPYILGVLDGAPANPPLRFAQLVCNDFALWIQSLIDGGRSVGKSTINKHRSALVSLFRDFGETRNPLLQENMKDHFRAVRRTQAEAARDGQGEVREGKLPLPITFMGTMSSRLLNLGGDEHLFGRAFLLLAWNLMCRSSNIVNICLHHMEWHEDALVVYFASQKNDQLGERSRNPRHVYANPKKPELCPILALGLYWLCSSIDLNQVNLFHGANQYKRFQGLLSRLLRQDEVITADMRIRGLVPSDLGTHSIRKGSTTHCVNTVDGPPLAAVCNRAGWSMGRVQDIYMRYEAAGDYFVGRTACGLDLSHDDFAILPPHFTGSNMGPILETINACIPRLPYTLTEVAKFALASVVYHRDYLRHVLPPRHRLFNTPLFTIAGRLEELAAMVRCGHGGDDSPLRTTGVPSHVHIIRSLKQVRTSVDVVLPTLEPMIQQLAPQVTESLLAHMDRVAANTGQATPQFILSQLGRLETTFRGDVLRELREMLQQHERAVVQPAPVPAVVEAAGQQEQFRPQVFYWGNPPRFHHLPEHFTIPEGDVQVLWAFWCCGNPAERILPLRRVRPGDLTGTNARKRLSDYRFLMLALEAKAREAAIWLDHPTAAQAAAMLTPALVALGLPDQTVRGRMRRLCSLRWGSVVNLLRSHQRLLRAAPGAGGEQARG